MKNAPTVPPPTTSGADLEELERLLEAASDRPWDMRPSRPGDGVAIVRTARPGIFGEWNRDADAALIVAAVNALPSLLARQRQLEAALRDVDDHSYPTHSAACAGQPDEADCICGTADIFAAARAALESK